MVVGEIQGTGVAHHHLHIRAGQPGRQSGGQIDVELHGGQVVDPGHQDVGGEPRARTGETPSAYRRRVTAPPPDLPRTHPATADGEPALS